jgi:hypothetical protein
VIFGGLNEDPPTVTALPVSADRVQPIQGRQARPRRRHSQLAIKVAASNFGTYLAQTAARSRPQPVLAGRPCRRGRCQRPRAASTTAQVRANMRTSSAG